MSLKGKNYQTTLGREISKQVAKYVNLRDFYDPMSGNIIFSYAIFGSTTDMISEVYDLLNQELFVNGKWYKWYMTLHTGYDGETCQDDVKMICLKSFEQD